METAAEIKLIFESAALRDLREGQIGGNQQHTGVAEPGAPQIFHRTHTARPDKAIGEIHMGHVKISGKR